MNYKIKKKNSHGYYDVFGREMPTEADMLQIHCKAK